MKCRCCGKEISITDRFCNYCGENNENYGKKMEPKIEKQTPKPKPKPEPIKKEPVKVKIEKKIEKQSPKKSKEQIVSNLSSSIEKKPKTKIEPKPVKPKVEKTKVEEGYIRLTPLDQLLIRKEKFDKLLMNTKILVPIGLEAFIYKNNSLYKVLYEGGEAVLNKGKKGLFKTVKDPAFYTIYTVNTNRVINEKWGMKYPIPYDDKELGTNIQLSAIGSYNYSINDPEIFIGTVVGEQSSLNNEKINDFFNEFVLHEVTSTIAKEMTQKTYFEIYQIQGQISEMIKENLRKKFKNYGVRLQEFMISAFKVYPEWVIEEHRRLKFAKNVK